MMKKELVFIMLILCAISFVSAQPAKMDVSTIKEAYLSGENISLIVSIYDAQNKPIKTKVNLVFEDVQKRKNLQYEVDSFNVTEIYLGENVPSGFWTLKANYDGKEASTSFLIESEELAEFSINGDVLIIKNVGNTPYQKTVQIIIGDIVGIKKPYLEIGESVSFRLVAPEGVYSIKATDGTTSIVQGDVKLTGEVIGILDNQPVSPSPITGVGPEDINKGVYNIVKQNAFVYIFIVAVIGSAILLTIERRYRKQLQKSA